jgi:hypothetical protein
MAHCAVIVAERSVIRQRNPKRVRLAIRIPPAPTRAVAAARRPYQIGYPPAAALSLAGQPWMK